MKLKNRLLHESYIDLGLLFLRITSGTYMLLGHGVAKMSNFSQLSKVFPDPIGLGSTFSLILAGGAEFFCSIAIILGLFTRIASAPLVVTMIVAIFVQHSGDPFADRELGLLYLSCFGAIMLMGPGVFSIDHKIR